MSLNNENTLHWDLTYAHPFNTLLPLLLSAHHCAVSSARTQKSPQKMRSSGEDFFFSFFKDRLMFFVAPTFSAVNLPHVCFCHWKSETKHFTLHNLRFFVFACYEKKWVVPVAVGVNVKNTLKQSDADTWRGTKLLLFIIAVLIFCIYPYHSNHCNYATLQNLRWLDCLSWNWL